MAHGEGVAACLSLVDNRRIVCNAICFSCKVKVTLIKRDSGNFLRHAVLPRAVRHWSLTTLREKLIKIGAKVVRHSRQVIFQMAEVARRELFKAILDQDNEMNFMRTPETGCAD